MPLPSRRVAGLRGDLTRLVSANGESIAPLDVPARMLQDFLLTALYTHTDRRVAEARPELRHWGSPVDAWAGQRGLAQLPPDQQGA